MRYFRGLRIAPETFKILLPSKARVKWLTRFTITFLGCLLLLLPIVLLFYFQERRDVVKLTIIVTTVLAFSVITSALTSAKNWEVVAASIAYAYQSYPLHEAADKSSDTRPCSWCSSRAALEGIRMEVDDFGLFCMAAVTHTIPIFFYHVDSDGQMPCMFVILAQSTFAVDITW